MATKKTAKKTAKKKTTKKTTKKAARKADEKTAKKTAKKTAEKTAKKAEKKTEKADAAKAERSDQKTAAVVELVDLEEMARQLRMPPMRVRQMLRSGRIRGVKVDGEWRFNPKLVYQTLGRRARGG